MAPSSRKIEKRSDGVTRPDAAAEMSVGGVHLEDLLDYLGRDILKQTSEIDARIEARSLRLIGSRAGRARGAALVDWRGTALKETE